MNDPPTALVGFAPEHRCVIGFLSEILDGEPAAPGEAHALLDQCQYPHNNVTHVRALRERIGNVARVEEAVTVSSNRSFTAAQQERVVRVFVSSTLRDMHAERDELIKRVFPKLRKLCEERWLRRREVDLRWGVTDEQKSEVKVLPICLAEIQRCRPYFKKSEDTGLRM